MVSRRKFLAYLSSWSTAAFGIGPIQKLLTTMMNGRGNPSFSRLEKQPCRNYVQFNMYGGPGRWFFDSLLKPHDDSPYFFHPMYVNKFTKVDPHANNPYTMEYATHKIEDLNFPFLWKHDIPTTGPTRKRMSNLLDHMMIIRGVHMEGTIGHPINSSKMMAPFFGGESLDGCLADASNRLIPAISLGNGPVNRAFNAKNRSVVRINSDEKNYLRFLLNPFFHPGKETFPQTGHMDSVLNEAISAMRVAHKLGHQKYSPLYQDLSRTRKLFRQSIDGLLAEYEKLVIKYRKIIHAAQKTTLNGIDDLPLPGLKLPIELPGDRNPKEALGMYLLETHYLTDNDIRDVLEEAYMASLAQEMALAEYVLTHGLSTSVLIAPKKEMGFMFENARTQNGVEIPDMQSEYNDEKNITRFSRGPAAKNKSSSIVVPFDCHNTGVIPNTYMSSKYYYVLGSVLSELTSSLGRVSMENGSVFDETVVHLTAEFDRQSKDTLEGTNHNEDGHVSTLFSGAIKGPVLLGNIFSGGPSETEETEWGTQGFGAPISSFDNQRIGIGNLNSSLCKILRIKPMLKRSHSFLELKKGSVISLIDEGKNIKGGFSSYAKKNS